ncbi:MAG TPA: MFS transporter, partial [Acidobacteriaceae bacterium]|nr:MFS transporter [Acidobacteriaceae bacterium]
MSEAEQTDDITIAEPYGWGGIGPVSSVLAVMLCGVCAFADLYATQPLLPLFVDIFHVSKSAAGLTVSASTLGVALSAPFVSMYAERLNRKRVIAASILALAIPTLLAATSPNLYALVFWRFLQGVLMPGIFATTIAYIIEEWSDHSVALVMAFYISSTVLGGFLGRLVAGFLTERFNWQTAFVVLGAINIPGGLLVALWLPHARKSGHPIAAHAADTANKLRTMLRSFQNPQQAATFALG